MRLIILVSQRSNVNICSCITTTSRKTNAMVISEISPNWTCTLLINRWLRFQGRQAKLICSFRDVITWNLVLIWFNLTLVESTQLDCIKNLINTADWEFGILFLPFHEYYHPKRISGKDYNRSTH